jgi:hypothetical protein
MKSSFLFSRIFLVVILIVLFACRKESVEKIISHSVSRLIQKSDSLPPLGCIRGYFGNEYKTFTQHIEKVALIDSFSNCFFYESCSNTLKQINLIRCDSTYVIAIYIMGISPDSLPAILPVPYGNGQYVEIQFYRFEDWNNVSDDVNYYHYRLDDFYGRGVTITSNTDDVLTGTFGGDFISTSGDVLHVSKGEFNIKIFRKYMACALTNEK